MTLFTFEEGKCSGNKALDALRQALQGAYPTRRRFVPLGFVPHRGLQGANQTVSRPRSDGRLWAKRLESLRI
jgi:hypothetical protein